MKKMVLGLALCLGLSQVVVAAKKDICLSDKEVKGAIAWIKTNPKKSAAIATGIAATLGFTAYAGYEIWASKENGKWARTKDGVSYAAYNVFVNPFVVAKDGAVAGATWTKDKVVNGTTAAASIYWNNKKYSMPLTALALIIATVVADYATTDKEAEMKIQQLWNNLLGKTTAKPVVEPVEPTIA